jgi:hypothetical protein
VVDVLSQLDLRSASQEKSKSFKYMLFLLHGSLENFSGSPFSPERCLHAILSLNRSNKLRSLFLQHFLLLCVTFILERKLETVTYSWIDDGITKFDGPENFLIVLIKFGHW